MNQTQLYRLADRALSGRLAEILAGYRDQNLSAGRMALRLAAEHQVEVSGPTLKKWVASLPPRRATGAPTAQTAQTPQTAKLAQTAQTARGTRATGPHVAVAS